MAARQVLSRPVLNRVAPFSAPRVMPKRNYITYRPKWADNDPVRPHQWGTRIAVSIFKNGLFVRACATPIIIINHFLFIRTDNQQKMNLI